MSEKYFDTVYHVYYSSRIVGDVHFGVSLIHKHISDNKDLLYLSSYTIKTASPDFFKGKPLVKALDKLLYRLAKQVTFNRFEICYDKIIIHNNPSCDIDDSYTKSWMIFFKNQFPLMVINEEEYPEEIKDMLEKHLDDLVWDYNHQQKEEDNGKSTEISGDEV